MHCMIRVLHQNGARNWKNNNVDVNTVCRYTCRIYRLCNPFDKNEEEEVCLCIFDDVDEDFALFASSFLSVQLKMS